MLIIDALIVILCILIGVRKGGIAVAFAGAFGLAILTFICGLRPTSPPIAVMLIILAVTSLAGTLQCSGGLDLLVKWAEILLRKNPNHITFLAPIVCFLFVTFTGTAFIAMALLPVISEVAREAGVRPERPLSVSCVASSHSIVKLIYNNLFSKISFNGIEANTMKNTIKTCSLNLRNYL